jgi:hypothetical protein
MIGELADAGLLTVGTYAEGRETWDADAHGPRVATQMAMPSDDDGRPGSPERPARRKVTRPTASLMASSTPRRSTHGTQASAVPGGHR